MIIAPFPPEPEFVEVPIRRWIMILNPGAVGVFDIWLGSNLTEDVVAQIRGDAAVRFIILMYSIPAKLLAFDSHMALVLLSTNR